MHSAVTLAIVHARWVKGAAVITEIPNNVIKMYKKGECLNGCFVVVGCCWSWICVKTQCLCVSCDLYIQKNRVCVCDLYACWYVVVCGVPPPAVPGATSVRQITSAGWVAVWSSTLWYELWVIAGRTTHWECYSAKMPSWRSNTSSFQAMYRPEVRSTGTRVCDLQ